MCEKQKRIEELELENAELYRTLAEISKFKSESANFDSQTFWRPYQIVIIPLILSFLAGGALVYAAVIKTLSTIS